MESTRRFIRLAGVIGLCMLSASSWAAPRRASLLFDASAPSVTPHALDYNEVTGEWAVLYDDASVRFFDWSGSQLAGYTANVSPLLYQSKYTDPGLSDLIAIGFDNATRYYMAMGGNPLSEPLDPADAFEMIFYQGTLPLFVDTYLHNAVSNVHLARYDLFISHPNAINRGYDVGLDATGTILLLDEDDRWVLLPNAGITDAESVCLRYVDTSPVVLHNNEVSVIRRKAGLGRTGGGGSPWIFDYYENPDEVVGEVLEHYAITNLPEGAQLIDIATVFDMSDQSFQWNDMLFVVDAVGGGVYALVDVVPGDANGDGKVDGTDLAAWQSGYNPLGTDGTWETGDWNGDGKVDGTDLALWQSNYDPLGTGASGLPVETVPEPATLMLLGSGLLVGGILRRRR